MAEQKFYGDGFITGYGALKPAGLPFRAGLYVFGGSLSEANAGKIVKIMDLARRWVRP